MTPENSLQASCIQWFRLQYPSKLIFSIPNGALLGGKNRFAVINMLKRTGLLNGVPDLFIAEPNTGCAGLFIELKVGKNKLRPQQEEIINMLRDRNYGVLICYSLDDFMRGIKNYFSGGTK